jgi:hypothetical protein
MPDIGNYPGGDSRFSDLSHNLRTWDLTSQLIELSGTPEELIFAYGWALHVLTDVIGHPEFTNISHAEIKGMKASFPKGLDPYLYPLEHKQTEFGASAYLLGLDENSFLWDVKLSFPVKTDSGSEKSIISRAFRRVYALNVEDSELMIGTKSLQAQIKRIPVVMKLLGRVKDNWHDILGRLLAFFLRNTLMRLYLLFIDREKNQGAVAVLKPFELSRELTERLIKVIDRIVEEYEIHLAEDFCRMSNTNLDNGEAPVSGRSRHADLLMQEILDSDISKKFENIFNNDYPKVYGEWRNFQESFFNVSRTGS